MTPWATSIRRTTSWADENGVELRRVGMIRRVVKVTGRGTSRRGPRGARTGRRLAHRSASRQFSLDTGNRSESNARSGEPGEVLDVEVNAHLGNPGQQFQSDLQHIKMMHTYPVQRGISYETQHTLDRYYRRRPRLHDRLSVPSEPVLVDLRLASKSSHVMAVAIFGRGSFWLHLAGVVRQKQYGLRGAAGHRPRHARRLGCGLYRASTGADCWHGEFARLDYGRAHGLVRARLRVFPVCEAKRFLTRDFPD